MRSFFNQLNDRFSLDAGLSIPEIFSKGNIPSLNGLRAVAILLVLADHLRYGRYCPGIFFVLNGYLALGSFGVQIFFVISGFLITGLLLMEKVQTGKISLKKFWLRRMFRIMPALYFFILVILLLKAVQVANIDGNAIVAASLFVSNFGNLHSQWLVVHSWSLSVEEQFYLGLPLLMIFTPRTYYWGFILIVVYYLLYYYLRNYPFLFLFRFFFIPAPSLLAGSMLALAMYKNWLKNLHRRLLNPVFAWSLVFAVMAYLPRTFRFAPFYFLSFDYLLSSVFIAAFIYYAIHCRVHSLAYRILNFPAMIYIGVLSYSIYLWQQPFLALTENYRVFPYWTVFPWNLGGILIMSLVSFYFIERPALNYKKTFLTSVPCPS